MNKDAKIFMENMVELRREYGLTKVRMAKVLGIGIGSWNKIERGELPERLSVTVVLNASKYFNVKPGVLMKKR